MQKAVDIYLKRLPEIIEEKRNIEAVTFDWSSRKFIFCKIKKSQKKLKKLDGNFIRAILPSKELTMELQDYNKRMEDIDNFRSTLFKKCNERGDNEKDI